MATPTNIVKFLVRRGLNSQRKQVILAQGELGMTVEDNIPNNTTARLFIGDGLTRGGVPVASKFYIISGFQDLTTNYIELYDMVFNIDTNKLYALTAVGATTPANYAHIGK